MGWVTGVALTKQKHTIPDITLPSSKGQNPMRLECLRLAVKLGPAASGAGWDPWHGKLLLPTKNYLC